MVPSMSSVMVDFFFKTVCALNRKFCLCDLFFQLNQLSQSIVKIRKLMEFCLRTLGIVYLLASNYHFNAFADTHTHTSNGNGLNVYYL